MVKRYKYWFVISLKSGQLLDDYVIAESSAAGLDKLIDYYGIAGNIHDFKFIIVDKNIKDTLF